MRTARSSSRLLGEGVCISACWDTPSGCGPGEETPWVWAWRPLPLGCGPGDPPGQIPEPPPPGCEPGDPPRPDPSTSPLVVGLETSKACWYLTTLDTCKACWDTTCNACWDITHPAPTPIPSPPPPSPVNRILEILEFSKYYLAIRLLAVKYFEFRMEILGMWKSNQT